MARPTICREPTSPSTRLTGGWQLKGGQHPNQIVDAEIKRAVDEQLAAKGLAKTDGDKADLWLPDRAKKNSGTLMARAAAYVGVASSTVSPAKLYDPFKTGENRSEFLVVGIRCCHREFLRRCTQNRLLGVVGAVRQAAHLNLQSNFILCLTHISVDAQSSDFFCGRVEGERHFIAGLRIVGKNQIHRARDRIQGYVAGLIGLLHSLKVRRNIHGEDTLHVLHVVLHFFFFLLDDSLLHPAATRLLRGRTKGSLVHLPVRAVPAAILRRGFRISFEGELGCFDPCILLKLLFVFGSGLLHGRQLLV